MLVLGQAPATAMRLDLGRGVVIVMAPLDAIQHATIVGGVQRDIAKLRAGEEPDMPWTLTDEEIVGLEDDVVRDAIARWMHVVLVAATGAQAIEGLVDPETGAAPALDIATFGWLFRDDAFLQLFRIRALSVERLYALEGNAFGSAPSGSGATASTIAPAVAPSSPAAAAAAAPSPATPSTSAASGAPSVPGESSASGSASAEVPAPPIDTPPSPGSAPSSGASDSPPASGSVAA